MAGRRYLFMHVSANLGHQRASRALKDTVLRCDPEAQVEAVDASHYSSRFVRWAISRFYISLIRHQPDVWEYLYDNPAVHRHLQALQALLHHYQSRKLGGLLLGFQPQVIACTQAYPCGVVAHFKRVNRVDIPLIGILTDYAPHLYWFHEEVNLYVVPSEGVKRRFVTRGVAPERIRVLGIPIDWKFRDSADRTMVARRLQLDPAHPIILIMGGGSGFGRIKEIVQNLDLLPHPCQFVVVAGTNQRLLRWLNRQQFRHAMRAFGYVDSVPELMDAATLLISKPGGLTASEALAKRLPLVMVNPIPGQEAYNARHLLAQGAAVQADSPETARQTVRDLLDDSSRLAALRQRISEVAHPDAALDIARLLMDLADRQPAVPPSILAQAEGWR